MSEKIWDKNNVIALASQFKTRGEFRKAYRYCYELALKNKWLDEIPKFKRAAKPMGYWSKENVLEEGKKYKTRIDFHNNARGAYKAAQENGWLDLMPWLIQRNKPKEYWTKDIVFEIAKKYKNKTEFYCKQRAAYNTAKLNGWLEEMNFFTSKFGYWTKDRVFLESLKYTNRDDFRKGSPTAYSISKKKQWLKDMPHIQLKQKPKGYWKDKSNIIAIAKECKSISDLQNKSSSAYNWANKMGWLTEIKRYFKPTETKYIRPYTIYAYLDEEEKVAYVGLTNDKEERERTHKTGLYRGRKSKSEVYIYFTKKNKAIPNPIYLEDNLPMEQAGEREEYWKNHYQNVLGYKMLNIAKCGSLGSGAIRWTKEKIFAVSRQYETRTEFCKAHNRAYTIALQNGWLDEMYWLVSPQKPKNFWNEKTIMEECAKYTSLLELRKNCSSAYFAICKYKLNEQIKEYFKEKNQMKKVGEIFGRLK